MLDNLKEKEMKDLVVASEDIGMQDLVFLCGLVAKLGKRQVTPTNCQGWPCFRRRK